MVETKAAENGIYIKTYGCQMNFYDSTKIAEAANLVGFRPVENIKEATMVVLNTCNIRDKAAAKVYSELGRIKQIRDIKQARGQKFIIVVAGCVSQAEGEEIFRRAPYVDIVVGPQSYHSLPELIEKVRRQTGKGWEIAIDFQPEKKFDFIGKNIGPQGVSAYLSIQEGCDKFCDFCVVPYTRGAEYSRPVSEIYREAMQLVALGTKKIILLGQNVNAYHGQALDGEVWNLAKLIHHLSAIPGLEMLSYTTSHPLDMDEELIAAHASQSKLIPYLHLPVQSGSDRILKSMNRKHNRALYFEIIAKLRQARPDIALSSDFIVGYPGETERDFEDTMDLVRQVGYAQCYSFKYSIRPGTPASMMDNQVPEEVKVERLARLQDLLREQQLDFNRKSVGLTIPVLLEKKGKHDGQLIGKSPYMQSVYVDAPEHMISEIVQVCITGYSQNSINGELI